MPTLKVLLLLAFCTILMSVSFVSCNNTSETIVSTGQQAIKIAEDTLIRCYGKDILSYRPFYVALDNNVWKITGYLGDQLGGVPYVEIDKRNGKVIKVTHGK